MSTLFSRLLQQALPHCTAAEAGGWPCETINSRHWCTLAAEGRWRVCVRVEPDCDCSDQYDEPPQAGTEWYGLVVQLQDCWGKVFHSHGLWAIESPGTRQVPASDWQAFDAHLAEVAQQLLMEMLADPCYVVNNLRGELAEREQMLYELQELAA